MKYPETFGRRYYHEPRSIPKGWEPRRPPKGMPVTIAAGFRFADGKLRTGRGIKRWQLTPCTPYHAQSWMA